MTGKAMHTTVKAAALLEQALEFQVDCSTGQGEGNDVVTFTIVCDALGINTNLSVPGRTLEERSISPEQLYMSMLDFVKGHLEMSYCRRCKIDEAGEEAPS